MKRLLSLLVLFGAAVSLTAARAGEQVLHYKVDYALGPIHKTAAHACVHLFTDGDNFFATLDGNSINWGGRIYAVRDTLSAVMTRTPAFPGVSERVVSQIGWYAKPEVSRWMAGFDFASADSYRNTAGGGTLDASEETMEAVQITTDMLGLFYFFRYIDFGSMSAGQCFELPVTGADGGSQNVSVTYCGPSQYSIEGNSYNTFLIEFEYSYDGAPSGYRIRCQLGRGSRVPLEFSADLKIGRLAMIYDI